MKKLIRKATKAIRRVLSYWKYRDRIHTIAVDEMPDTLIPRRLYLIGSNGMPWSAAILCPCGCGEAIQLSLLNDDSPSWTFKADLHDLPVLSPSVWRTKGCRSHFFLRHGMIEWCRNDNR